MHLIGRLLITLMILLSFAVTSEEVEYSSERRIEIPVGIYITSLYDLDIPEKKFTVSAWIWSTYNPALLPEEYKFHNKIEDPPPEGFTG